MLTARKFLDHLKPWELMPCQACSANYLYQASLV